MLKKTEFDYFCAFVKARSGLCLDTIKRYLVEARLTTLLEKHGLDDFKSLAQCLEQDKESVLSTEVVEEMLTYETFFFREEKHLKQFQNVILPFLQKNRKEDVPLRIWSAACSTGQEPYSLAMLLNENREILNDRKVELLATDISTQALKVARKGCYSQFEVQRGLSIRRLVKYFFQKGGKWCLKDDIKKWVHFKQQNLLENFAALGSFDVIFCRNALLYFDEKTRENIIHRLEKSLVPDGFLYLGGTESLLGLSSTLQKVDEAPGMYRPIGNAGLNFGKKGL